jgi:hypothetical protein
LNAVRPSKDRREESANWNEPRGRDGDKLTPIEGTSGATNWPIRMSTTAAPNHRPFLFNAKHKVELLFGN